MTREKALELAEVVYTPDLPLCVLGGVTPLPDGRFLIAINSRASAAEQASALEHELAHIQLDHLTREEPVKALEAEVERFIGSTTNQR